MSRSRVVAVAVIAVCMSAVCVLAQGRGASTFTDPRDGQVYRTVRIGSQTWMAQNLNFNASGSWCYDNNSGNCNTYGRLYTWPQAMGFGSGCDSRSCASQIQTPHQGVCPPGWHVPSHAEWTVLTSAVGGASTAGTKLKARSGWNNNGNGTDDFGVSALPGGSRWSGNFNGAGNYGRWWSATESDATYARYRGMNWDLDYVFTRWSVKTYGFSVRCLRD